jgi:transposase
MNQEKEQRRKYDKELKLGILRLVNEQKRPIAQVARDFGLGKNTIYKWKKAFEEDRDFAFPGTGHLKPEDEQFRQLKRDLERVTEERDILKKALAIFSKTPR